MQYAPVIAQVFGFAQGMAKSKNPHTILMCVCILLMHAGNQAYIVT